MLKYKNPYMVCEIINNLIYLSDPGEMTSSCPQDALWIMWAKDE